MIEEGGEEMEISLQKIYNKTMKELEIPAKWEDMVVKSVYKNKDIQNIRGLFIISIVGKLFEKILMEKQGPKK